MSLLLSFAVAATVTLFLLRYSHVHGQRSCDSNFEKPQGFHTVAVPRIGGLGILVGLVAGAFAVGAEHGKGAAYFSLLLLACALPAFGAGFVQDLTEALTPRGRLVATALSAILAFFLMDAAIRHTAIPGLDWLVGNTVGSFLVTVFAVAGIANSVNIIDGFNGLAAMCVALMLAAIAYVSFQVGDTFITALALAGIGSVLGFFVWNYPSGLIFLGDGGAYFLGFFVAEISILLLVRNPEVSPIFPLLVCIYPAFETVFSIYRRCVLRAASPSVPDGIHLHSLVYRRVMRWAVGDSSTKAVTRRNSLTSPYLWMLCMFSVVPAVLFWDRTPILGLFLVVFVVSYVVLYWRIVRFRAPRWLVISSLRSDTTIPADNRET